MKRDTIYYQIFKRFPGLLFELIEQPPPQARHYRFDSVEIKETSFRIDGVFLPPEGTTPKTIFFAEVQFQKDEALYHRFFTESLTYLYRNQTLYDDWQGVIIFPSRNLEPANLNLHRALLNSDQVQRIYLDELGDPSQQPAGIGLMQLTIASETEMFEQAKQLIDRVEQEAVTQFDKNEIIEVITTIAVYKFSQLTREEVEAMLGRSIEETRIYQDLERQTKLKVAPQLLDEGLTVERVAQILNLSIEEVRQLASNQNNVS
jgi:predicted transposase/invertase (TIGR01784 family)